MIFNQRIYYLNRSALPITNRLLKKMSQLANTVLRQYCKLLILLLLLLLTLLILYLVAQPSCRWRPAVQLKRKWPTFSTASALYFPQYGQTNYYGGAVVPSTINTRDLAAYSVDVSSHKTQPQRQKCQEGVHKHERRHHRKSLWQQGDHVPDGRHGLGYLPWQQHTYHRQTLQDIVHVKADQYEESQFAAILPPTLELMYTLSSKGCRVMTKTMSRICERLCGHAHCTWHSCGSPGSSWSQGWRTKEWLGGWGRTRLLRWCRSPRSSRRWCWPQIRAAGRHDPSGCNWYSHINMLWWSYTLMQLCLTNWCHNR